MKRRKLIIGLMAIVAFGSLTAFTGGKWDLLGTRTVNYAVDHDEIVVTGWEGKFDAVKLKVLKGAINMHRFVVHFANGGKQEIELKNNFAPGQESRVVDLTGDDRVIRRIEIWYDTKNKSKKRAIIQVWGKH